MQTLFNKGPYKSDADKNLIKHRIINKKLITITTQNLQYSLKFPFITF